MKGRSILFGTAVVGVAMLHFLGSFMATFIAGMGSGSGARWVSNILLFPLSLLPGALETSPALGWAMWIAVSLCWGYGICAMVRFLVAKKSS